MCIAILTTPGKSVSDADLFRWWTGNDDGGGFAYVDGDQLKIEKGYLSYNEFQKAYRAAVKAHGETSPFLVHMRIRTSGHSKESNTHPFRIKPQGGPEGAVIHNGILFTPCGDRAGPIDDLKSDTRILVETYNNVLRLADVKAARDALGTAIGKSNKMAFLYANKEYVIVNEDEGLWHDGCWYSNNHCRVLPQRAYGAS